MPQRQELKWTQLRVGAMVAVALILFGVGIFFISGSVGFLTRKYTLETYFASATGLRPGSQVQLAGIPVGTVKDVHISSFSDPNRAVSVRMSIAKKYQSQIRADSKASNTTAGLLGEAYIDISRGGPNQPPVPEGGVVLSENSPDMKAVVQNANDVISNLRVLSSKLNDITNEITAGQGTFGKLLYDPSLYNKANQTMAEISRMVKEVHGGTGTLGRLFVDPSLYDKLNGTIDRANSLLNTAEHGNGTLGRLMSDPSLYNSVNQTISKADAMIDHINKGEGTLGKLARDPSLYNHLNDTVSHVESITARMDKGEGTLGAISTDKTLYNNIAVSAQSLREFLTEFRQNPRKFLTIRVKVF